MNLDKDTTPETWQEKYERDQREQRFISGFNCFLYKECTAGKIDWYNWT